MLNILVQALESAVNAYLRLDPEALARLAPLEGRVIKLVIEDWRATFYLLPSATGFEWHTRWEEKPAASLSGTLRALINLGMEKAQGAALFKNKIYIEGDPYVAEVLRDVLGAIDIDWEEHLAQKVGDQAAHRLGAVARKIKATFLQTRKTLSLNMQEFLHYELKALPTRAEVEDWSLAVTQLMHAVERAAVRLYQLEHRE